MSKIRFFPVEITLCETAIRGAGEVLVDTSGRVRFRTLVTPDYDSLRSVETLFPTDSKPLRLKLSGRVRSVKLKAAVFDGLVGEHEPLILDIVPQARDLRKRGNEERRLRHIFRGDPTEWVGRHVIQHRIGAAQSRKSVTWKAVVEVCVGKPVRRAPTERGEHIDHRELSKQSVLERFGPAASTETIVAQLMRARDPERALLASRPPDAARSLKTRTGVVLGGKRRGRLRVVDNPAPTGSMGYASQAWHTPKRTTRGVIEIALPLSDALQVQRDSIRVFHWDDHEHRWSLITASGVVPGSDLAWARTSLRGIFVAVGLHSDPAVRETLALMARLAPLALQQKIWGQSPRFDQLCHQILCPPFDFSAMMFEDHVGRLDFSRVPAATELADAQRRVDQEDWIRQLQPWSADATGKHPAGGGRAGLNAIVRSRAGLPDGRPDGGGGLAPGFPPRPTPGSVCEDCLRLPDFPQRIPEWDLFPLPPLFYPTPPGPGCTRWENIGPEFPSGVVEDIAFHPTDANVFFVAGQHGGVFRTTDNGSSWLAVTDHIVASKCMGVAIEGTKAAGAAHPTLYAAFWSTPLGADFDFYASTDLGASWERRSPYDHTGNDFTQLRCVAGRTTPGLVYVGTNRGLYCSEDGGRSWVVQDVTVDGATKVNVRSLFDGVIHDVVIDPADDDKVWIAVAGVGILFSDDGGVSWTNTTATADPLLRSVGLMRIDVGQDTGASGHGGDFVVAKIARQLAYTDDRGATWTVLPPPAGTETGGTTYGGWCSSVAIDPSDERRVFAGGWALAKTDDITATPAAFALIPGQDTWADDTADDTWHADHQMLRFSPHNPVRLYTCNDGGLTRLKADGSNTQRLSKGLVLCQNFYLDVSQTGPFEAGASTYHCGVLKKRNSSLVWDWIGGNEGGLYRIDPRDSTLHFKNSWGSGFQRSTANGASGTWTSPAGFPSDTATDARARRLESKPWGNQAIVCTASYDSMWISTDDGANFAPVADAAGNWLQLCGDGGERSIGTAIAFSQSEPQRTLVGTNNGRIWSSATSSMRATDWQRLPTEPLAAPTVQINAIAVHPINPQIIYVGYARTGNDNLFRTDDGGLTWQPATASGTAVGLPLLPVTDLYMDPMFPRRLVCALRYGGIWITNDGGDWWDSWDTGLPRGIEIKEMRLRRVSRDLYVAAYGRGIWVRRL